MHAYNAFTHLIVKDYGLFVKGSFNNDDGLPQIQSGYVYFLKIKAVEKSHLKKNLIKKGHFKNILHEDLYKIK